MKIDILFFSYSGASPVIGNAIYKLGFSNFFSDRHFPSRLSKMFAKLPMCGYLPLQTMNVEIHVNDQIGDANCEFNIKLIKVNRTEELSRLWLVSFILFLCSKFITSLNHRPIDGVNDQHNGNTKRIERLSTKLFMFAFKI